MKQMGPGLHLQCNRDPSLSKIGIQCLKTKSGINHLQLDLEKSHTLHSKCCHIRQYVVAVTHFKAVASIKRLITV